MKIEELPEETQKDILEWNNTICYHPFHVWVAFSKEGNVADWSYDLFVARDVAKNIGGTYRKVILKEDPKRHLHAEIYKTLVKALSRYTWRYTQIPLCEAWVLRGTRSKFRHALERGYLRWATKAPDRGEKGFLCLTEKGAAIVQRWIEEGYNADKVYNKNGPPNEFDRHTYAELEKRYGKL